jgi:mono/diheme cytochrome c family protein
LPVAAVSPEQAAANPGAIQWDAEVKELKPSVGEATARFTFWLTNVSSSEVLVNSVRTSCGCTVAQLPSQPWHIPAGEHGPIEVTVNLAGKSGMIAKGVTVDTSVGVKQLTVKVDIPPGAGIVGAPPAAFSGSMNDSDRTKNMQLALADRQVVFKNAECAKCHADPAKGQSEGRLLYTAACATCHNSHLRAALVPDLRALKHPTDADFWRQWITYGRAGSMMPAFAAAEGGPLSPKQIDALVEFMVKAFPNRTPQPAQAVPPAPHPAAQIPSAAGAPLIRATASRSP